MHSNDGQQQGGSMVLYDLCIPDPRPSADMLSDRLWAVADRLLNTSHLFDHLATFQGAFIAALREFAELKIPPYRLLPLLADLETAVPSDHPLRTYLLHMIGAQRAQLWRGLLKGLTDARLSFWLHHEQEQVPALAEAFSPHGIASPEQQDQYLQDYLYQNSFLELLLSKTFRCLIVGAKANLAPEEYLQICRRIDEVLKAQWRSIALSVDSGYQSLPSYQTTLNKVVGLLQILHVEIGQSAEQADWYVSQESVENWLAGISEEVAELYPPKAAASIPPTPEPEPEVEALTQASMWDWLTGSASSISEGISQVASAVSQALTTPAISATRPSSSLCRRRGRCQLRFWPTVTAIGAVLAVSEVPVARGAIREFHYSNHHVTRRWSENAEDTLHGGFCWTLIPDSGGKYYGCEFLSTRAVDGYPFAQASLDTSVEDGPDYAWQPSISEHRGVLAFDSPWLYYSCNQPHQAPNECESFLGSDWARVFITLPNHIPTLVVDSEGKEIAGVDSFVGNFGAPVLTAADEDTDELQFIVDYDSLPAVLNPRAWLFDRVKRTDVDGKPHFELEFFGTAPAAAQGNNSIEVVIEDKWVDSLALARNVTVGRRIVSVPMYFGNRPPDEPLTPAGDSVLAGEVLQIPAPRPSDVDGNKVSGVVYREDGEPVPDGLTYENGLQAVRWPTSSAQRGIHRVYVEYTDDAPEEMRLSSRTEVFTVGADNNPPEVALTLAPLSGHANARVWLQPAPGVIVDADGDLDPLTYSIVRLDGLPLPDGFYVNPNSGVGYWDVPAGTAKGQWGLALQGCDPDGACAQAPWYVTLEPRGVELAMAGTLRLVTNGVGQSYVSPPLAPRYREPDGDAFTVQLFGLPQGLSFNGTHVLGMPEVLTVGPTSIGARVTDTDGVVFQETGEVFNPNSPPAIEVIGNHTSGVEQTHLQVSATDPDGKSSTLAYSLTNNPDFVRISSTSGRITFNPPRGEDVQGTYPDIEVIVTDEDHSRYGNGQSTMRFTYVIENGEIRLVPGVDTTIPVNCQTNRLVDVREFYEEPDGDEVTEAYITEQSLDDPNDPPVVRSGSTLSISPLSEHQGRNYTVRVALSDGHGSTQVLRLAFPIPNRGPVRKKELGLSFTDSSASQLPYGDAIEDPDGGVISYVVEEVPESCEDEQASLQLVCEAGSTETARYTAYLIGCDLGGECRREPIELTANPVTVRDAAVPTGVVFVVTLLAACGWNSYKAMRRTEQQRRVVTRVANKMAEVLKLGPLGAPVKDRPIRGSAAEDTEEDLDAIFDYILAGLKGWRVDSSLDVEALSAPEMLAQWCGFGDLRNMLLRGIQQRRREGLDREVEAVKDRVTTLERERSAASRDEEGEARPVVAGAVVRTDSPPSTASSVASSDTAGRIDSPELVAVGEDLKSILDDRIARVRRQIIQAGLLGDERMAFLLEKLHALSNEVVSHIERLRSEEGARFGELLYFTALYLFIAEQWRKVDQAIAGTSRRPLVYGPLGFHRVITGLLASLTKELEVTPPSHARLLVLCIALARTTAYVYESDMLVVDEYGAASVKQYTKPFELSWEVRMRMAIQMEKALEKIETQHKGWAFILAKLVMSIMLIFPDDLRMGPLWLMLIPIQQRLNSQMAIARQKSKYVSLVPRGWVAEALALMRLLPYLMQRQTRQEALEVLSKVLGRDTAGGDVAAHVTHVNYWALQAAQVGLSHAKSDNKSRKMALALLNNGDLWNLGQKPWILQGLMQRVALAAARDVVIYSHHEVLRPESRIVWPLMLHELIEEYAKLLAKILEDDTWDAKGSSLGLYDHTGAAAGRMTPREDLYNIIKRVLEDGRSDSCAQTVAEKVKCFMDELRSDEEAVRSSGSMRVLRRFGSRRMGSSRRQRSSRRLSLLGAASPGPRATSESMTTGPTATTFQVSNPLHKPRAERGKGESAPSSTSAAAGAIIKPSSASKRRESFAAEDPLHAAESTAAASASKGKESGEFGVARVLSADDSVAGKGPQVGRDLKDLSF